MPRGAFLQQPAPTIQDLQRQVNTNNAVCIRYARLFHLSPTMVRLAVGQMHLTRLTQNLPLEIHYVHPGERIGYKLRRLPKGTLVYALPDGTPALVEVCGNPVRKVITARLDSPEYGLPGLPDFSPQERLGTLTTPTEIARGELRTATPATEASEKIVPVPPPAPTSVLSATDDAVPADSPFAPPDGSAATPGINKIAALLPGLLFLLPHSSGSGSAAVTTPDAGRTPPPNYQPVAASGVLPSGQLPSTPGGTQAQQTQTATTQVQTFINNNNGEPGGGGGGGGSSASSGSSGGGSSDLHSGRPHPIPAIRENR